MIDNKNVGKLTYGSLTNSKQDQAFGVGLKCRMHMIVFWLPLSWFQCCDIYFAIKEFVDNWIFRWDPIWYKKNIEVGTITNIDLSTSNKMVARIEQICNDCELLTNETATVDKNLIQVFKSILSQVKDLLQIISPRLNKVNNFIHFYTSLYRHGMYIYSLL